MLIRSSPSLLGRWGASGWNSGRQATLKTAVTLLHPLPGRAAGHEISSRRWGRGRQSNPPVTPTVGSLLASGRRRRQGGDRCTDRGRRQKGASEAKAQDWDSGWAEQPRGAPAACWGMGGALQVLSSSKFPSSSKSTGPSLSSVRLTTKTPGSHQVPPSPPPDSSLGLGRGYF